MSSQTKSKSTSTMTYGQTAPIDSPDIGVAKRAAEEAQQADPSIKYHFARRRGNLRNALTNPFGANVAPETMEAMKYAREGELDQEFGQALSADAFRRKQQKFQNLYQIAGLTAPRTVQTGGSTTGTVSQPMWPGLVAGGLSAGLGV